MESRYQAGPNHFAARRWSLRSPAGDVFRFSNLRHFIRENPGLFPPAAIQWKLNRSTTPPQPYCRAYLSLSKLRPRRLNGLKSWKGWTWAS